MDVGKIIMKLLKLKKNIEVRVKSFMVLTRAGIELLKN